MVDMASNCGDLTAAFHSWHGLGSSPSNLDSGVGGSPGVHSNSLLPTFRRQGSMQSRKLLPTVPDMDTQLSLSAKMIDKRTCTPRGNHSYGPFFLEYSLLAEYNLLQKQKMPGVYVIPSEQSSLVWYGVIFIRQGIYQEGIFRFKVFIPDNYPDGDCPRLVFDHDVFHPLVDPATHEMDVQRGFSHKWKRNVNHIWQILLYARRCFYKIDTKDPLNIEAAELFERNCSEEDADNEVTFRERVRDCVMDWRDRIYERPNFDDPHYLVFTPFEPKVHEPARQAMLTPTPTSSSAVPISHHPHQLDDQYTSRRESLSRKSSNGHTFLEPGSLRIFSSS